MNMVYIASSALIVALCSAGMMMGRKAGDVSPWACAFMVLVAGTVAVLALYEGQVALDTGSVVCKRALPCTRAEDPVQFWFTFVFVYVVGVMGAALACTAILLLAKTLFGTRKDEP